MDFGRAFSYIFDDQEWVGKLALLTLISLFAYPLSLFLIGLAGVAILFGYQVKLVYNWRLGAPHPLPRWDDIGEMLTVGAPVLVAFLVYNLPNALLTCGIVAFSGSIRGDSFAGATGVALVACCLFPLLLVYNVVIQPVLALGIARYSESRDMNAFFQVSRHIEVIRNHTDMSLQYLLFWFLAGLALVLLGTIPCVGWLALPALGVPVYGALIGQYTENVLGKPRG